MKLYGPDKLLPVLLVLPQEDEEPSSDLELTDFAKVNLMLSALSRANLPIVVFGGSKSVPNLTVTSSSRIMQSKTVTSSRKILRKRY